MKHLMLKQINSLVMIKKNLFHKLSFNSIYAYLLYFLVYIVIIEHTIFLLIQQLNILYS